MKTILFISFALGLIAIASALTCKTCDFRFVSLCITGSSNKECTGNCSHTSASFGSFSLFSKQGCKPNCTDEKDVTDSTFNFRYNTTCCNTNECNSGSAVKFSVSLGLGMGLLWLLNAV
ncbi:lymphocyte antigen 6 complex locus protein G6c [Hyla sarda]|uniref:lymphocyte antigen 6 complex locus protein G6c n=1 Tax=Hyla sarda TaxID=327740 RepID=UPI0024C24447|nr:lymphocyte antigen 6 complex locus protein G6c [Hyla sarda]